MVTSTGDFPDKTAVVTPHKIGTRLGLSIGEALARAAESGVKVADSAKRFGEVVDHLGDSGERVREAVEQAAQSLERDAQVSAGAVSELTRKLIELAAFLLQESQRRSKELR